MEKKFSGKIWKFGNDIDTDTIIPGKRGTIPDRNEMKKYAFELLKPEFGSTVQPGDILVAGTNFGCGSSREQAATVLSYNGVRCIIAKSFARIFFRNAFNSGILLLTCDQIQDVCEGGDIVTVDVDAQTVSVNGKTFKVGAVPENLYNIVANGGLIEDTKKRLAAGNVKMDIKPLSMEQCRKKGYTMVEKILKKNAGKEHVAPGDIVITKPDMFMIHDIYTTYLLETMKDIGADKIDDPDKVTIVWDHCMPTAVAKNDYDHYEAGLELAKTYGIKKLHIGEGICHTIMHEAKYAKPGEIATATDSHTTTYGGAGNFCSGIGTAEMAAALITGELWFKVPEAIKIVLNGHLRDGVMSKDVILRILGDITPEKVRILQEADDIYMSLMREWGLYDKIWQAGVILLPIQSVGVMGDERTYENTVALRAVTSTDAMTADWAQLPYEFLAKVSNEIINKVKGVNRVVYDISSKPPATIEWE